MVDAVKITFGIPEHHHKIAADLFCEAFLPKIKLFLGDADRASGFLSKHVVSDRAFIAELNGKVVGIAGFKHDGKGVFEPGFKSLMQEYGWLTGIPRMLGLLLLERSEKANILLMDGICVNAAARGKGVGTKLLKAIESYAQDLGMEKIRLDVIDTNPDARRLYERFGFIAGETKSIGPLKLIFPFNASTTMTKTVA